MSLLSYLAAARLLPLKSRFVLWARQLLCHCLAQARSFGTWSHAPAQARKDGGCPEASVGTGSFSLRLQSFAGSCARLRTAGSLSCQGPRVTHLFASAAAQARDGVTLLTSGRKHRTAALQAAEVIAFQAEQSELADLIEEEEGGDLEPVRGPFDPLTSQVAKGPRTIRRRNPEGLAGRATHKGLDMQRQFGRTLCLALRDKTASWNSTVPA